MSLKSLFSSVSPPPLSGKVEEDSRGLPSDLYLTIASHLIKSAIPELSSDLFLAIQGPPGQGKTYTVMKTCELLGIGLGLISGSELSSMNEGGAVSPLKNMYISQSEKMERSKKLSAILIDDFDLSIASRFGNSEYTVNTQLLTSFMMNLADHPETCGGITCHRVPIIVTANDLTSIHPPLLRAGRMKIVPWTPSQATVIGIARNILSRQYPLIPLRDIDEFVGRHRDKSVAFFSSLVSDVDDLIVRNLLSRSPRDMSIETIRRYYNLEKGKISIDAILKLADTRAAAKPERFI